MFSLSAISQLLLQLVFLILNAYDKFDVQEIKRKQN